MAYATFVPFILADRQLERRPDGLLQTLGMPLLDYVKSYFSEVTALRSSLPMDDNCVASAHLGEPLRAMLHYYAAVITRPRGVRSKCGDMRLSGSANRTQRW